MEETTYEYDKENSPFYPQVAVPEEKLLRLGARCPKKQVSVLAGTAGMRNIASLLTTMSPGWRNW
jgi:hypothetical protein